MAGNEAVGNVWAQHLPPDGQGYGFLDVDTPEMSIGVRDDWRGRGLGRALLRRAPSEARARQLL